jgi:aspartokinase/homoserine dehydrogenase 1
VQVVKFGGTSVANAATILKVVEILKTKSAQGDPVIAVVSALGGMTDSLQQAGELANQKDARYLTLFGSIHERHLNEARLLGLSPEAMESLETLLEALKSILKGVFLINEFSEKTKDKVLGYGELLSSFIIS